MRGYVGFGIVFVVGHNLDPKEERMAKSVLSALRRSERTGASIGNRYERAANVIQRRARFRRARSDMGRIRWEMYHARGGYRAHQVPGYVRPNLNRRVAKRKHYNVIPF